LGKPGQNRLRFPEGGSGGHDLGGNVSAARENPLIFTRIDEKRPISGQWTFPLYGVPRKGFLGIISGKGPEKAGLRGGTVTGFSWT